MKPNEAFMHASNELITRIVTKDTKKEYVFRKYTYGVLVPDSNHPLVNVGL